MLKLPAQQRAAFVMYERQQRSMVEVASQLDCPLKTAFTRLYAARARVNRALRRGLGVCAVLEFAPTPQALAMMTAGAGAPWTATLAVTAAALVLPNVALPVAGAALLPGSPEMQVQTAAVAPSYAITAMARAGVRMTPPIRAEKGFETDGARPVMGAQVLHFDVQAQQMPALELLAYRVSLTEVVPIYAIAGQLPELPAVGPVPVQTRLVPEVLDAEALRLAIEGRRR